MLEFLITAILLVLVAGSWFCAALYFLRILRGWSGDLNRPVTAEVWILVAIASSAVPLMVIRVIHYLVSSL